MSKLQLPFLRRLFLLGVCLSVCLSAFFLFVCYQLHVKNYFQIFMKITTETRKNWLNVGNQPHLDRIQYFFIETDRKRILRFRPKTKTGRKWHFIFGPKPKRKRKRNSVVQVTTCDKVMYFYVNTQMMQHKYKITKILDTTLWTIKKVAVHLWP